MVKVQQFQKVEMDLKTRNPSKIKGKYLISVITGSGGLVDSEPLPSHASLP